MNNPKIAFIVPAHNEQQVIVETIQSLLEFTPAQDIYVVDDNSTDATSQLAKQYTHNVLHLSTSHGKAGGLNTAISYFNLTQSYEFIMPIDADTKVTKDFLTHIWPAFKKDTKNEIAAVVGRVVGQNNSWITAYRLWEYEIAQSIHKSAQDKEGAIMVCPGCATVYRSELFKSAQFPTGTLTEDMDLTFQIHRKKLGKIVFASKAEVVTQDPNKISDLRKQLYRWYTGFWQCVSKHNVPWGKQMLDLEVGMLASEGLLNSLLVIMLLILSPLLIAANPWYLISILAVDLLLFMVPTVLWVASKYEESTIIFYIPHFYFMRIFSSFIFLFSFIKVVTGQDLFMGWNKPSRYTNRKEGIWQRLSIR